MDIKKNLLLLARAIPSTALVEDFEAKRALDAMAEILRKLVVNEINRQAEVKIEPKYLSIVEGDGILITKLPNNVRRITAADFKNAADTGSGSYQESGGIDLTGVNDGDIIAWDETTDEAFEVHAMASLADKDQIEWDDATKKWIPCTKPHDPGTFDTVGSLAEGSEAAEGTTKIFSNGKGLKFNIQSRSAYYHAGDKKLYGYSREMRFDRMGRLYYVSGETRWEIDVPVAES